MVLILLLVLSGVHPFDRTTWLLEVFPVLIALPVLWATHRRFPLTGLLYVLIFATPSPSSWVAPILCQVPLGFQIADLLHLSRNPYDKIGHFFQGFVPAMIAREIFIRGRHVKAGKMLGFLVICVALAISAAYELIEWGAAIWLGQGADEFLGTQGDPWDTQSDMFAAFVGAVTAILVLTRTHDQQLARVSGHDPGNPGLPPARTSRADRGKAPLSTLRILVLTALAMTAFAGNSLLCRLALKDTAIDAASFTTVRLLSGALMLWLVVRLRGGGARAGAGNWPSALALFAYAAGFSFAYITLPAATGALLLFGAVQATMIGHGLWRGERLRRAQSVGLVLALGGLVGLLLPGLAAPPLFGAAMMLGAGIAWGVYSLRGRVPGDATRVTAGNFLRAMPIAAALSVLMAGNLSLDRAGLLYAVASGRWPPAWDIRSGTPPCPR